MLFNIFFTSVHSLLNLLSINTMSILLVILNNWEANSVKLPDGFVEVRGILSARNGPNNLSVV